MKTLQSVAEKIKNNPPGILQRPAQPHGGADPDCQRCGGFGWEQAPQFDNHWFICHCVVEARNAFLANLQPQFDPATIGLHESELSLTWDAVKPDISDGMKAVNAVKPAYERGWGMIFLWGTYGQAKTLIGKILTATAFRDGKSAVYANVLNALDNIRLAFDEQEHKTTELLRRMDYWISRDVLFLDELDKVNSTSWAQERMFELLDRRYVRAIREEAFTVISSNRSDAALDGYLKSRLNDKRLGPVVRLNGIDGRTVMPEHYKF